MPLTNYLYRMTLTTLSALLVTVGALGQNAGRPDSMRFAVIGDAGTGGKRQHQLAAVMEKHYDQFPFGFVLMLGDNLYGKERPRDYERKFEEPYRDLLEKGVAFYAVLGNHDRPEQRFYPLFNMNGRRYYAIHPKPGVRILALDSTQMDAAQLQWLEEELSKGAAEWTIVAMHHPLYSSGKRHGPALELRKVLEPIFIRYGVDVVFAGHEHFYERHSPQSGIQYFISGAAGKLRRSDIERTSQTACGYDQDNSFIVLELNGEGLHFSTITRDGAVVDRGTIRRDNKPRSVAAQCTSLAADSGATNNGGTY